MEAPQRNRYRATKKSHLLRGCSISVASSSCSIDRRIRSNLKLSMLRFRARPTSRIGKFGWWPGCWLGQTISQSITTCNPGDFVKYVFHMKTLCQYLNKIRCRVTFYVIDRRAHSEDLQVPIQRNWQSSLLLAAELILNISWDFEANCIRYLCPVRHSQSYTTTLPSNLSLRHRYATNPLRTPRARRIGHCGHNKSSSSRRAADRSRRYSVRSTSA